MTRAPTRRYVTISEIREWRSCQRKWWYGYHLRQRPVKSGAALYVGGLAHLALEEFWKGASLVDARREMLKKVDKATGGFWHSDKGQVQLARTLASIEGYFTYWESEREKWELVEKGEGVERWVRAELDHLGLDAELVGRIDAVARFQEDGALYMIEHKTTSDKIATTGEDYWQRLAMDLQVTAYQELLEIEFGEPVRILYDVIRKIQNAPVLKKKAAKRKSETPEEFAKRKAQNEIDNRETPQEFSERMVSEINDAPADWFVRRVVPRLKEDKEIYREERDATIAEMFDPDRTVFPRNDSACISRFGTCPYLGICTGIESWDSGRFHVVPPSVPGYAQESDGPSGSGRGRRGRATTKGAEYDDEFGDVPDF